MRRELTMKRTLLRFLSSLTLIAAGSLSALGQGSSTSSLSGAVVDPAGEVVPGASVVVKNTATGAEFQATTASNGTFSIPALGVGTYTVTISATGFKQAVLSGVKVDAATPASVRVSLEVGAPNESVVVQGGSEVVQTQSATISTTLSVKQIASLPLQTRNVLDFVVFLPGTNTTGGARDSTARAWTRLRRSPFQPPRRGPRAEARARSKSNSSPAAATTNSTARSTSTTATRC
jgi:hypothetical protein